jgi:hypothetical protein
MKAKMAIKVQMSPQEARDILDEIKRAFAGKEDWLAEFPFLSELRDRLIDTLEA